MRLLRSELEVIVRVLWRHIGFLFGPDGLSLGLASHIALTLAFAFAITLLTISQVTLPVSVMLLVHLHFLVLMKRLRLHALADRQWTRVPQLWRGRPSGRAYRSLPGQRHSLLHRLTISFRKPECL
jgi:hypothetical protein